MIIDDKKIAKVIVKHGQSIIGILSDEEAKMAPGYTAEVILDTRPGKDAIAYGGDVLYYEDTPDTKYIVTQADDKFFVMVPVKVDNNNSNIEYLDIHRRVYPNNINIGTLSDYGIILEFRGKDADENGSTEN